MAKRSGVLDSRLSELGYWSCVSLSIKTLYHNGIIPLIGQKALGHKFCVAHTKELNTLIVKRRCFLVENVALYTCMWVS